MITKEDLRKSLEIIEKSAFILSVNRCKKPIPKNFKVINLNRELKK